MMGDRAEKRDGDEVASLQLFTAERVLHSRVRQQGAGLLSMLSPSRPSGSKRSSSSSPSPSPAAGTSKPSTHSRAAAISLEFLGRRLL